MGLECGRGRPRDSRSGDRRYKYIVEFAFPFDLRALGVFYAVEDEVLEAGLGQKAASAAMPSGVLGNEAKAPSRPMRASNDTRMTEMVGHPA